MNALERTLMTISCRDTDIIPKVSNAGKVIELKGKKMQIMHNGIKVIYGGYYGDWMAHVIRGLNGHHEPQEELLFHTLMRYVRNQSMIFELGAFWGYYTQWFLNAVHDSLAVCIEPDKKNLDIGRCNAELNKTENRICFLNAWIGREHLANHLGQTENSNTPADLEMLNYSAILDYCSKECIELLHIDTQGAELPFLQSIKFSTSTKKIRFIMVSTHHSSISGSKTTHQDCIDLLRDLGASILVEHDIIESFSGDGLILASMFPEDKELWFPPISRNRAEKSLFKHS